MINIETYDIRDGWTNEIMDTIRGTSPEDVATQYFQRRHRTSDCVSESAGFDHYFNGVPYPVFGAAILFGGRKATPRNVVFATLT